ncbi:TPA: hypothetical protein ACXEY1_002793 [Citrobacter braakii]
MPFERLTIIIGNVGLGEAAKRSIGTGTGQVPDMSSFEYQNVSGVLVFRLPGGLTIQCGQGLTDSNGNFIVSLPVAMSLYFPFAGEGNVSGWNASGGIYSFSTWYGSQKLSNSAFQVRSSSWRESDKNVVAQPTVFNWFAVGIS